MGTAPGGRFPCNINQVVSSFGKPPAGIDHQLRVRFFAVCFFAVPLLIKDVPESLEGDASYLKIQWIEAISRRAVLPLQPISSSILMVIRAPSSTTPGTVFPSLVQIEGPVPEKRLLCVLC
jgi:hypothetical protein